MIRSEEICIIGSLLKPHGIKGEIVFEYDCDEHEISDLEYIILSIDGIYVPFYIMGYRPKSNHTCLLQLEGVDNESDSRELCGSHVLALKSKIGNNLHGDDDYGFYTSDLIGFTLFNHTDGAEIGRITDFDDSTDNILLIVEPDDTNKNRILIPLNADLIEDIDYDSRHIVLDLPEGIISLNN